MTKTNCSEFEANLLCLKRGRSIYRYSLIKIQIYLIMKSFATNP